MNALEDIVKEYDKMTKELVQGIALCGMTALGIVALVVDGDIGTTVAVAISGAFGAVCGYLFPKTADKE